MLQEGTTWKHACLDLGVEQKGTKTLSWEFPTTGSLQTSLQPAFTLSEGLRSSTKDFTIVLEPWYSGYLPALYPKHCPLLTFFPSAYKPGKPETGSSFNPQILEFIVGFKILHYCRFYLRPLGKQTTTVAFTIFGLHLLDTSGGRDWGRERKEWRKLYYALTILKINSNQNNPQSSWKNKNSQHYSQPFWALGLQARVCRLKECGNFGNRTEKEAFWPGRHP